MEQEREEEKVLLCVKQDEKLIFYWSGKSELTKVNYQGRFSEGNYPVIFLEDNEVSEQLKRVLKIRGLIGYNCYTSIKQDPLTVSELVDIAKSFNLIVKSVKEVR